MLALPASTLNVSARIYCAERFCDENLVPSGPSPAKPSVCWSPGSWLMTSRAWPLVWTSDAIGARFFGSIDRLEVFRSAKDAKAALANRQAVERKQREQMAQQVSKHWRA